MLRIILLFSLVITVVDSKYEPNWDSLDTRPIPGWYDKEKFGIFSHWGVYSYIGLKDAWFWYYWKTGDPEAVAYMKKNYPPGFTYADFGPMFMNDLFDANQYAEIVKKSGAR